METRDPSIFQLETFSIALGGPFVRQSFSYLLIIDLLTFGTGLYLEVSLGLIESFFLTARQKRIFNFYLQKNSKRNVFSEFSGTGFDSNDLNLQSNEIL